MVVVHAWLLICSTCASLANQYLSKSVLCEVGLASGLSVCAVISLYEASRVRKTAPSKPGSFNALYAWRSRSLSLFCFREGSAKPLSDSGRYSMCELVDLDSLSFFGSDVGYPVAKGNVGVLGGVTTVGRAFEDGEGETEGVAVSNGCEEFAPDVAVGEPSPTERGEA